jgi:hypothetical protein
MSRQMCWLLKSDNNPEMALHLRTAPNEPWRLYTTFPQYAVPDYRMANGSKGWATYQKLIKAGWTLVPTARASEFTVTENSEVKRLDP